MFYYDEPPAECFECSEKENRLDDVKYWFQAIVDQLYGVMGEFDAEELDRYVQEAAAYLGMKMPTRGGEPIELAVVRKNRTVEMAPMLDAWKSASVQYLKSLAKTGS